LAPSPVLPPPEGVDRLWALLAYDGAARALVGAFKYRHRRSIVDALAPAMAALVEPRFDVVTWLPATPAHRRSRGYDQARLLALGVAHSLGLPAARLLQRRRGPPQTGRPALERAEGPALVARRVPAGSRVLLVDDVVTTGASMRAAALALLTGGAARVSGVALARTPLKTAVRTAETSM
jgi:predicted amidophosphoribosyltransferase